MIEVRVPDEQEGTKAVVRAWLKQIGDIVFENDPLVELETDKVTQEVPSPVAGVLAEIVLDTDAEAVPGALLGKISTDGELASTARPEPVEESPPPSPQEQGQSIEKLGTSGGVETRLSPSVRRALQQHGIEPSRIQGTGRDGTRIRAEWSRRRRHTMVGITKWFDSRKGFGFIAGEGGPDIFVHYSDIEGEGFRRLADGERVEFELTQRDRGPAAINVRRISRESPLSVIH